jgi:cysteine desulfurase/selenocysteine lyase
MTHDVDLDAPLQFEHGALKFGAGTPNVSGPVGWAAAIDYVNRIGRTALSEHERALNQYALKRLGEVDGLKIVGPKTAAQRIPVFTFSVTGRTPESLVKDLDAAGVAVRGGDLASLPLLKRLGLTAAVRASCYLYTSVADIDALVDALKKPAGKQ